MSDRVKQTANVAMAAAVIKGNVLAKSLAQVREGLMLVTLKTHQWYPRKFDRAASDVVAKEIGSNNAAEIGRFNKLLVERAAIKPLREAFAELRDYHYLATTLWEDRGPRMLPASCYFDYQARVNKARDNIETCKREFLADYDNQIKLARARLGKLFSSRDYPLAAVLADHIGVEVSYQPLPDPANVRVWRLGKDDERKLEQAMEKEIATRVREAQQDVVTRLQTALSECAEKLAAYERGDSTRLFETVTSNLGDIARMVVGGLNVTNDPKLAQIASEALTLAQGANIGAMKARTSELSETAAKAATLSRKMQGVFGKPKVKLTVNE